MSIKRNAKIVLTIAALSATAFAGTAGAMSNRAVAPPAHSASGTNPATHTSNTNVDPRAAAAFAKQEGISVTEAATRLGKQKSLSDHGHRLAKGLAGRTGGIYLDDNGRLVVTTLDASGDAAVVKGGAKAQRVDDSEGRMDLIVKRLDQAAKHGSGGVQGWYIDVKNNTVVVTVTDLATDAKTNEMGAIARSFGDSVRIDTAPASQAPKATEYMVGGYEVKIPTGGFCSAGFNTVDSSNRAVVLTAGHCVTTAGTVSRNGYIVGRTRTASFPDNDYGTFWNSYPSYWQPTVSVSKYNGTFVNIRGSWNLPPVGATVCKSGRTTGYTCGTITALNQSVTYTGGIVVSGLVRHNACVEGGDSGGANISAGAFALGMTSGAAMTSTGKCLSKAGQANISWYQPIGEALSANGLRLVYQP